MSFILLIKVKKVKKDIDDINRLYCYIDSKYPNDPIMNYQLCFKQKYKNSFDGNISLYTIDNIKNKLYLNSGIDITKYVSNDNLFLLNDDGMELVWDYLYQNGDAGKNLYSSLSNLYSVIINNSISEFEKNYIPYKEAMNEYLVPYNTYASGYCLTLIISFFIGFILAYIPFQIIFKAGRSIGYRVVSLASIRTDMMDVKTWNVIVKDILLFILTFSSIFFMVIFLGKIQILSTNILGPITLFQLILFSFFLDIVSLVFFFINKSNQTLSEFTSMTMTVNTKDREEYFFETKEK